MSKFFLVKKKREREKTFFSLFRVEFLKLTLSLIYVAIACIFFVIIGECMKEYRVFRMNDGK